MTYSCISKRVDDVPCFMRSKVWHTNYFGGNAGGELAIKHLLTYFFENFRVNRSKSFDSKTRLAVFSELFVGIFKDRIIPC
jgi:hypothetical protein